MKKPVVDYRQFRPGKLNDPQFSHLKLLGGWILYFILYFPLYEICGLKLTHAFLQRGGFLEFPPYWSAILVAILFWGAQSIVLLICHVIHRIRKR